MSIRGEGDTEGDWAGLFVGIEALAALPSMRKAWLSGLSYVAPADLVVRSSDVVGPRAVLDLRPRPSMPRQRIPIGGSARGSWSPVGI